MSQRALHAEGGGGLFAENGVLCVPCGCGGVVALSAAIVSK